MINLKDLVYLEVITVMGKPTNKLSPTDYRCVYQRVADKISVLRKQKQIQIPKHMRTKRYANAVIHQWLRKDLRYAGVVVRPRVGRQARSTDPAPVVTIDVNYIPACLRHLIPDAE